MFKHHLHPEHHQQLIRPAPPDYLQQRQQRQLQQHHQHQIAATKLQQQHHLRQIQHNYHNQNLIQQHQHELNTTVSQATTTAATDAHQMSIAGSGPSLQLVVQSKRKEKARIAARARRSQEASIILEIANELHIKQEKLRRIDKATIVKLAIDYIKAFEILCRFNCISGIINSNNYSDSHIIQQPLKEQSQQQVNQVSSVIKQNDLLLSQQQQLTTPLQQTTTLHQHQTASPTVKRPHLSLLQTQECRRQSLMQQQEQEQQQPQTRNQLQPPQLSAPKLSTTSIFAPKTVDNMNSHFLMIEEEGDGKPSFVLKPDTDILEEDDLTHLAPQAGDISISLDVDQTLFDNIIPIASNTSTTKNSLDAYCTTCDEVGSTVMSNKFFAATTETNSKITNVECYACGKYLKTSHTTRVPIV